MVDVIVTAPADAPAIPIHPIAPRDWPACADRASPAVRAAAALASFAGKAGELVLVPTPEGAVERVLFGLGETAPTAMGPSAMAWRGLSARLAAGDYQIVFPEGARGAPSTGADAIALAWALGTYRFDRYKQERGGPAPRLVAPPGA